MDYLHVIFLAYLGVVKALELPSASNVHITREGCSAVLTCSGESTVEPVWRKRGATNDFSNAQTEISKVTSGSVTTWHNSLIIKSVTMKDAGQYLCDIYPVSSSSSSSTTLTVRRGKMDVSISHSVVHGQTVLRCHVETCLKDVAIQFFTGSKLLKSTTEPMSRGWLGSALVEPGESSSGTYVCQAMSDAANLVLRRSTTLS